jgi:hypothetical protein
MAIFVRWLFVNLAAGCCLVYFMLLQQAMQLLDNAGLRHTKSRFVSDSVLAEVTSVD